MVVDHGGRIGHEQAPGSARGDDPADLGRPAEQASKDVPQPLGSGAAMGQPAREVVRERQGVCASPDIRRSGAQLHGSQRLREPDLGRQPVLVQDPMIESVDRWHKTCQPGGHRKRVFAEVAQADPPGRIRRVLVDSPQRMLTL